MPEKRLAPLERIAMLFETNNGKNDDKQEEDEQIKRRETLQ